MLLLRRLFALGLGAAVGAYLVHRRQRDLAAEPRTIRGPDGRSIEPRFVELEGGECVPVVDVGSGPAVVLVPGLTGDHQVFRYQIPAFTERYRVIAPNLRADFEGVDANFDQFAADLGTVLDELGVSSATLLGLSFGGPICLRFARLHPDRVEALILTNTLARLDLSHVGLNRTLLIPLARWSTRHLPVRMMRRLAELWGDWRVWVYDPSPGNDRIIEYELTAPVRIPTSVGTLRMATFKDRDLRGGLPEITAPALVIAGATDTYTPNDWQREIADLLPAATYAEVPNGGHLSLISQAETFNRMVLEWLEEVRSSADRRRSTTETA
ncbi:MAG: alpha/beta fold hydrolase [Gemmatimonadetes bacterium]|uniref:Alpha/beta fold hydrolase n=1 Tax=Candidatus Kutchimonas denitrificans TaxID=3056748 RepID=A0AAE4ZAY0_9BACT|nr:alpha/beta fold hydrolase [Gemmatimonadota bacterium]NIR76303.1 alpha/beta fold hydrolase [Candidatus Kutchimonas denitrificans]NIS02326.1 alpha/beta fold hydrolase [Gemmatimonadota bacterium]NIT68145.1 alpha/beta fold hydrolase [Gemmatimonadota bacterium]NIU54369.1 alpha/beta fold hydrolase [Gemmatimonadota bacterium]